jgi:hypothetical protein
MRAKTKPLLLTLALATATANCAGDGSVEGLEDAPGDGSAQSAASASDLRYAGSWLGTWSSSTASTDQGSLSLTVSASGDLTGEMMFAGAEEQSQFGAAALTGHITGASVAFSYKFANLSAISGAGSFRAVSKCLAAITFSTVGSSEPTGHFDLAKQGCLVARILDHSVRASE